MGITSWRTAAPPFFTTANRLPQLRRACRVFVLLPRLLARRARDQLPSACRRRLSQRLRGVHGRKAAVSGRVSLQLRAARTRQLSREPYVVRCCASPCWSTLPDCFRDHRSRLVRVESLVRDRLHEDGQGQGTGTSCRVGFLAVPVGAVRDDCKDRL